MKCMTSRFGEIEYSEQQVVTLHGGMIGFPKATSYLAIPHPGSSEVMWLQSTTLPEVAFPTLNGASIDPEYPDILPKTMADQAGIAFDSESDLALLVVLSASEAGLSSVNLLAPIIINEKTRFGAQVILNGTRFGARAPLTNQAHAPENKIDEAGP